MKPLFKSPNEERSYSFFKGNFLKQIKKLSKVANSFESAVPFFYDINAHYNDDPGKPHCLMVFGRLAGPWKSYIKKEVAANVSAVSGLCYAAPSKEGGSMELFLYNEKGKGKKQFKKIRKSFKAVVPPAKLQLHFIDINGKLEADDGNLDVDDQKKNEGIKLDEVNEYISKTDDYDNTIKEEALKTEKISLENLQDVLKTNAKSIATELKELVKKLKLKSIRPRKALSILKGIEKDVDRNLSKGVDYKIDKAPERVKELTFKFNKDIQEVRDYLNNLNLDKEEDENLEDLLKAELKSRKVQTVMEVIEADFKKNHEQFHVGLNTLKEIYQTLNATK
ncbi:MAG: hypothetical protein JKY03_04310 [Aureispira sp.]|nr:hypothetical protein [Aureispira sp.]